jgi:hypothetical protein
VQLPTFMIALFCLRALYADLDDCDNSRTAAAGTKVQQSGMTVFALRIRAVSVPMPRVFGG